MSNEKTEQRVRKVCNDFMRKFHEEFGYGKDMGDALFLSIAFGKSHLSFANGETYSLVKLLMESMDREVQVYDLFMGTFLAYMNFNSDNSQRSYIVAKLMDMIVRDEEKDSGTTPRVKVMGFDMMPEHMKEVIGEALSKEFAGHIKPNKEDVKPSEN